MKTLFTSALLAILAVVPGMAIGHGSHQHGANSAKPVTNASPPEQQDWGIAAPSHARARRIEIRMDDQMRFAPANIEIKLGETIRFVVHNDGKVLHEMVIGTRQELDKHAALMLKHPNMVHDEPWMAHVDPGKAGEILWTFNRLGNFEFACLIPGHFQAGMRGAIRVSVAGAATESGAHARHSAVQIPDRQRPILVSQPSGHSHHAGHSASVPASTNATPTGEEWVDAEVRRIDLAQARITLRHGEIKSFDMPPMTMVFHAKDARLLDGLSAGDQIRFRTVQEDGRYTVIAIEKR